MLVDVISFYLPLDSGIRIAFKISILLGYTVFRVNMMDELPATAVRTPLIGVFFVVCMALLMLSLIKSILVVKLLHHSEKEVRQMSVSACLLDKYGSAGHESVLTSIKTLDHINTSRGKRNAHISFHLYDYELEPSLLDGDLLSLNEIQDAPSGAEWLLQELVSLRLALSQDDSESSAQADWLTLCSRLDCFLFRVYLLVLVLYTSTLLLLWASWSFA
uniref:Neurotransmitter-gated ion-channel transmembrane domain-containing protein n=1 Tax=Echeneis naucrates TaxID=173247 RepID=A0A665V012_ECHNA